MWGIRLAGAWGVWGPCAQAGRRAAGGDERTQASLQPPLPARGSREGRRVRGSGQRERRAIAEARGERPRDGGTDEVFVSWALQLGLGSLLPVLNFHPLNSTSYRPSFSHTLVPSPPRLWHSVSIDCQPHICLASPLARHCPTPHLHTHTPRLRNGKATQWRRRGQAQQEGRSLAHRTWKGVRLDRVCPQSSWWKLHPPQVRWKGRHVSGDAIVHKCSSELLLTR